VPYPLQGSGKEHRDLFPRLLQEMNDQSIRSNSLW
jgi:hypothetical protein